MEPAITEQPKQLALIVREAGCGSCLHSQRPSAFALPWVSRAAARFMGLLGAGLSALRRELSIADYLGGRVAAPGYAVAGHAVSDGLPTASQDSGHVEDASLLIPVHTTQGLRHRWPQHWFAALFHDRSRPSGIQYHRTTRIVNETFTGTVYNLSVADDESFVAEGVVVHNCECDYVASEQDLDRLRAQALAGV